MNILRLTLAAAALALASTAPAHAAGSGSSGSVSPSPRADPAQAYQQGVAALQAQDYAQAIRHLRTARRASPNDGAINYVLGLAYVGNGDNDDARESFERSVRSANAPIDARVQLGRVYLELGQRTEAEAQQSALTESIAACDASCGDARRAELQRAHDQLAQALAQQPAAVDPASWNFPNDADGRAAYAQAIQLINTERFPDAMTALQRAHVSIGPHPDVLNYMGFVSRKMDRFDDALSYYTEALRLDPDHLGANEYLGELYVQLGELDRARVQLARLDQLCAYSCAERDELAHWIATAR